MTCLYDAGVANNDFILSQSALDGPHQSFEVAWPTTCSISVIVLTSLPVDCLHS